MSCQAMNHDCFVCNALHAPRCTVTLQQHMGARVDASKLTQQLQARHPALPKQSYGISLQFVFLVRVVAPDTHTQMQARVV